MIITVTLGLALLEYDSKPAWVHIPDHDYLFISIAIVTLGSTILIPMWFIHWMCYFCLLILRSDLICPHNWCGNWHCWKKQWAIPRSCHYCRWTGWWNMFDAFLFLLYRRCICIFYFIFYLWAWNASILTQVTRSPDTPPGRFSPQEQATINSVVAAR